MDSFVPRNPSFELQLPSHGTCPKRACPVQRGSRRSVLGDRAGMAIPIDRLTGYPEPGKHIVYDDNATIDLARAQLNGGILIQVIAISSDPYLRERMRDPSEETVSFVVS